MGSRVVAKALRDEGAHVEVHDDFFPQDTPNTAWLTDVGRRGWAVITQDKRIRRRAVEREALHRARGRAFVVTTTGVTAAEVATILIGHLERMRRTCAQHQARFIARVTRSRIDVDRSMR